MTTSRTWESGLRYLAVAYSLREQILGGVYQPGQRLPGQHDMAKANGVSFATLKAALDLLEEDGYVLRKVGKGTYATLPKEHVPVALVVDDDPAFCEFLVAALRVKGWKGLAAQSGRTALELLREQTCDLVILDLIMPEMNGAETFREIRRVAPNMEVVIVTGYPDSAIMSEALEVGPFAVMKKPFSLEELDMVLSRVQRSYQAAGYSGRSRRRLRERATVS